MGHTTRIVPLVRELLDHQNKIWIAANEIQESYIASSLASSDVHFLRLESHEVAYGQNALETKLKLLHQFPNWQKSIRSDHQMLSEWQKEYHFDWVISDARLGFYHEEAKSILINHQINPLSGLGEIADNVLKRLSNPMFRKFDQIWIPDTEEDRLAGTLSSIPPPLEGLCTYIGFLSPMVRDANAAKDIDYLFILSGPEPQKSLLEKEAMKFLENGNKGMIVGGDNGEDGIRLGLVDSPTLSDLLSRSLNVISRSGYSTLMDLHIFPEVQVYLSPTPGQAEQEYLYKYHLENKGALPFSQLYSS